MKAHVIGYSHKKGDYEGRAYDYVLLYVIAKMEQKDAQRGSAGIEMRAEPALAEKMAKIEFTGAVVCEIETEQRATGKGTFVPFVISCVPVALSGLPK